MGAPQNPPAFPVSSIDGFTQHGMDLRDWFAGQALIEFGSLIDIREPRTLRLVADLSYGMADAMLSVREQGK